MRSVKAIFKKQAKDSFKNRMVLVQFLIFPIMAFVLTELVAKPSEDIPDAMFVTMFAAMFSGMAPLTMTAGAIAEDKEHKSLRFLVTAGVKPQEYLLGVGGFVLLICSLMSVAFGFIGGFAGLDLPQFISVLILGSAASMLLGASIGILSKNQQAATATSVPVFMLLSFTPMIANFNDSVAKLATVFYTQQVNTLVNDSSGSVGKAFLIMLGNIAVFLVLFVLAYQKKGLKG